MKKKYKPAAPATSSASKAPATTTRERDEDRAAKNLVLVFMDVSRLSCGPEWLC